ncbi:ABC transporter permease [bacterium]|nr:ABC transporter permease [bacterium]
MLKFGDIIFAISQALKSFSRRGFITFLSISTITAALVVFGIFGVISTNLRYAMGRLEKKVGVEVYLPIELDETQTEVLKSKIEAFPEVEKVIYISREKAYSKFKREYGDNLLKQLDENPFPASFQLRLKSSFLVHSEISELTRKLEQLEGVSEIASESEIAARISRIAGTFRLLEIGWGVLLFIAATVIILNTIKFTIAARKDTIMIMELVGATRHFVQRPFIYEGMLKGFISGIFAALIIYGLQKGIRIILPQLVSLSDLGLGLIVLLGIVFGGIGSKLAVRKFL